MENTHFVLKISDYSLPLVIYLHGFTADLTIYSQMIENCPGNNYLLIDFYGHGKSSAVKDITTKLLVDQVDSVVSMVLTDHPKIKDLSLVGHSQGGVFAANYTLMSIHRSFIKSLLLITPGGVDFQLEDVYTTPWHIIPRLLYCLGTMPLTQNYAIKFSALALDYLHRYSSDKNLKAWIEDFKFFKLEDKLERLAYFNMIGSMLDNLDLLKDKRDLYRTVARQKPLRIDLIIGSADRIVTKSAGLRLAQLIATERGSEAFGVHVLDGGHDVLVTGAKKIVDILLGSDLRSLVHDRTA